MGAVADTAVGTRVGWATTGRVLLIGISGMRFYTGKVVYGQCRWRVILSATVILSIAKTLCGAGGDLRSLGLPQDDRCDFLLCRTILRFGFLGSVYLG